MPIPRASILLLSLTTTTAEANVALTRSTARSEYYPVIMQCQAYSSEHIQACQPSTGVLMLEFNRAPVNAFQDLMWEAFGKTMKTASRDASVRVIVLASAIESGFTAGLDITSQADLNDRASHSDAARKAFSLHAHLEDFQAAITTIADCRQPVIAAIAGNCLGLGIDIASACDIRLAADNVKMAILEVNVGLAADIGTLQRFPKIVGNDSLARELALTGRVFGAAEALHIGFVGQVIPGGRTGVTKAAVDLAAIIALKSPVAVTSTKHLMNHARDHSVADGLAYTAAWNMSMLQADDVVQAMHQATRKTRVLAKPFEPLAKIKRESKL